MVKTENLKDTLAKVPLHRNTVEFLCYADYGLFTDPLYKLGGEKCTLPLPTYEALKGILASVYWKPTIIWVIDAVRVMNRIQTEAKGVRTLKISGGGDLSYYTYLKDCAYQVRAHFVFNLNRPELEGDRDENKHHNIAKRMIEKGGRRDVFFGARECQGYVGPCVFGENAGAYDSIPRIDFGMMYHGMTYPDEAPAGAPKGRLLIRYAPVTMKNGVIEFCPPDKCQKVRTVRGGEIKRFSAGEKNFSGVEKLYKEVCEA